MELIDPPLTRDELAAAIEGRGGARRVPMALHMWVAEKDFGERQGEVAAILARYPMDLQIVGVNAADISDAPPDEPEYKWAKGDRQASTESSSMDARVALADWAQLDRILAAPPDPWSPRLLASAPPPDGRYRLGYWCNCLFEAHWRLRGLENALLDYYVAPESVMRLLRAFTDFTLVVLERGQREAGLDGVFITDDLGGQPGPMFSPEIFRRFHLPFYAELIDRAHSLGMHFWLHSCGNVAKFIPDFVSVGLDVLHPIQKYAMEAPAVVRDHGGRLCFYAGFDVQQVIPWGSSDEVRAEVRAMIDTFHRPEGRLVMGVGNVIHNDCPISSLEALFDETFAYGTAAAAGI